MSGQYGRRDEACPVSTGGREGGGGTAPRAVWSTTASTTRAAARAALASRVPGRDTRRVRLVRGEGRGVST